MAVKSCFRLLQRHCRQQRLPTSNPTCPGKPFRYARSFRSSTPASASSRLCIRRVPAVPLRALPSPASPASPDEPCVALNEPHALSPISRAIRSSFQTLGALEEATSKV
jgi:hypothetical protein